MTRSHHVGLTLLALLPAVLLTSAGAQAKARGFTGSRPVQLKDFLPHPMDAEGYSEQWSFSNELGDGQYLNLKMELTNAGVGDAKGRMKIRFKGHDGKKMHKSKRCKVRGRIEQERAVLRCGGLTLRQDREGYTASFSSSTLELQAHVVTSVPPWRPGDGRIRYGKKKHFYDLLLAVPRGKLTGRITVKGTEYPLDGVAFADHSYSSVTSDEVAKSWLRFKRLDPQKSLLFSTLRAPSGERFGYLLIADDAGRVLASASPVIELRQSFRVPNGKPYKVPAELWIKAQAGADVLDVHVLGGYVTKVKDLLKGLSSVERFVAERYSEPYGYSMSGVFRVRWERPGATPLEFEDDGSYLVEHINP